MKDKNQAALLGAILAATVSEQEKEHFMKFERHHFDMPTINYSSGIGQRPFKKLPLSKQQQKRRAANKRAKKARKRNR